MDKLSSERIKSKLIRAIDTNDLDYLGALGKEEVCWLDKPVFRGVNAAHYACHYNRLEVLKLLLQIKPDLLNQPEQRHEMTLLIRASCHGYKEIAAFLMQHENIYLEARTYHPGHESHQFNALHWASVKNSPEIAAMLLQAGCPVTMAKGNYPVHLAASRGHTTIVKLMVEQIPESLNQKDYLEQSPLIRAVMNGHADTVQYLVDQGASLDAKSSQLNEDTDGYTALDWAIHLKRHSCLVILVKADAGVISRSNKYPLHQAASSGNIDIMKALVDKAPELINQPDEQNETPIFKAIRKGDTVMVRLLINHPQINLNSSTSCPGQYFHHFTILHWAAWYEHLAIVEEILQSKFDMSSIRGTHPVHLAARKGNVNILERMTDKYPDLVHLKSTNKNTPLAQAAYYGCLNAVKWLLTKPADLENKTSALNLAAQENHLYVMKTILDSMPDETPDFTFLFHLAAHHSSIDVIRYLLAINPACLNQTRSSGKTALHLAALNDRYSVVEYLVAQGADINLAIKCPGDENDGKTALDLAMQRQHFGIANFLIRQLTSSQNKEEILNRIKHPRQALELMADDPELAALMLKNESVMDMLENINDPATRTNDESIVMYRAAEEQAHIDILRRYSFIYHINKKDKTDSRYVPTRTLGTGIHGKVRLFANKSGDRLAVKSPVKGQLQSNYQHENQIYKRLHPENRHITLFGYTRKIDSLKVQIQRQTIPFKQGKRGDDAIKNSIGVNQLARIIHAIARALLCLHQQNIVHGDAHLGNVLVQQDGDQFIAEFIDFGMSCDTSAPFYMRTGYKNYEAPEICDRNNKAPPDPAQDIYRFGLVLGTELNQNILWNQIVQTYPSIKQFLLLSQTSDPDERRPLLSTFCEKLDEELRNANNPVPAQVALTR